MLAVGLFIFQRVNTMDSKGFDVPLSVMPNSEFVPTKSLPEYVRVTVETTKNELAAISENDITVSVDLSTYNSTGTYSVPITVHPSINVLYLDAIEINIRPNDLKVTLDKKEGKYVSIHPIYRGSVAPGYELTGQSIMPEQVWVEGPASILDSLRSIPTEQIDITGRNNNISRIVRIGALDASLQINTTSVQYSAKINSIQKISEWRDIPIVFINLNEKFKIKTHNESAAGMPAVAAAPAENETDADKVTNDKTVGASTSTPKGALAGYSGSIKLQGNILAFESFTPTLHVDCSSIDATGEYGLPVMMNIPAELQVVSIEPVVVSITVEEA
jgi:hypothetical protein